VVTLRLERSAVAVPPDVSPSPAHAETAGAAVIVLDGDGNVLTSNLATIAVLGPAPLHTEGDLMSRLELGGRAALWPLESMPREAARRRDVQPDQWLEVTVHALGDVGDGRPLRVVVVNDVTAQRQTRQLREAFASVVAHELRTPVTTIYGGAQLLADPSVSDGTRRSAATAVASEAERLYRLVEDLVVLARMDTPFAIGDEMVLLQRFVPRIVAEEEQRAGASVDLRLSQDLPAVVGREGYVEQTIRHLVGNAIRYSAGGPDVRVRVESVDGHVQLTVLDWGSRIEVDDATHFFDLYHRSSRAQGDASGANIGLYLCRRLIEAMGGAVWATPHDDGLELGFSLPVANE
jgi:signal transduction histidine kinase